MRGGGGQIGHLNGRLKTQTQQTGAATQPPAGFT